MPVAKGAAYLLSSVHQKKTAILKANEAAASQSAALLDQQAVELDAKERHALRRRKRGCRHCRRNHDVRRNPILCNENTHVKCIGCDKILVNTALIPPDPHTRIIVRSCCVEFYGKLSKVIPN